MPEFVSAILVPDVDKAANLPLKYMLNGHDDTASIAEGRHV